MEKVELYNGVYIPQQMMGTSIWDYKGNKRDLQQRMNQSIIYCLSNHIAGLDTGRDYHNEKDLGYIFNKTFRSGIIKRDDLFITTKVGNSQQRRNKMSEEIDLSLKYLKLDYVDLWLLHWPLPDFWIENWKQMCEVYKSGKVRAIGIANCRERHIEELLKTGLPLPHVIQVEHHPFRTIPNFLKLCKKYNIQLEAYSSNCLMLPFVKENVILQGIASKHNKTIAQVMTRWHIQHGVIPIFSSFNIEHIKENVNVYDFSLTDEEMKLIFSLDSDYKFHPESINCPGY